MWKFADSIKIMPTNRELGDDDDEIVNFLNGGKLDNTTVKGRENIYRGFEEFFAKETDGQLIVEALEEGDAGKEKLDLKFAKYFYTMEVTVKNKKGEEVVRRPKLGYALKIKSALKCSMVERLKVIYSPLLDSPL